MSLHPAVAAVRGAVREARAVREAPAEGPGEAPTGSVLVACSGGADSLALLSASVFELRRSPRRVIGVVVDHGLQDGSAAHTSRVVEQMAALGVDETASIRVTVEAAGLGPEAAAREARYDALVQLAQHFGSDDVLLGHTLDDQAETVLLGLTRGSGGRSLAGMRPHFYRGEPGEGPRFERPLLGVRREQTVAACRAEGLEFWDDPHNADPRFLRSRVRHTVLPMLERELGPGVAETLARTATQLRRDVRALDAEAEQALRAHHDDERGVDVRAVEPLPAAVRMRMLRLAALRAGCPPAELTAVHVEGLERQVWNRDRLPREVQLPGHVSAVRSGDTLRFVRRPVER